MRKLHQVLSVGAAIAVGALTAGTASADQGPDPQPAPPAGQDLTKGSEAGGPTDAQPAKGASGPAAAGLAALGPANDNFSFAQFLPSANNSISGNTTSATAEAGEPSHGDQLRSAASKSIWYSWTAPASGRVLFRTIGSNFDTVMAAYLPGSAPGIAGLTQIAANDDLVLDNSTTASQIRFAAVAGQRYFIAVDGFAGASGNVKLTWTTNDDFDAAPALSGPAEGSFATFGVHNEGATLQVGEPKHAGNVASTSVWFKWTAPFSGNATFETTQNAYDTILAVYTGSRVDQLTEVTSNDDLQPGNHRSRVLFAARAGQTYRIALAGFGGQSGFEVVNYKLVKRQIIAGVATAPEGPAGSSKVINMPVTLTTASPAPVTVHFATADGTAKAGTDYTATSGDLTFAPGQTSKTVPVTIRGDATKEQAETFSLKLSNPTADFTLKTAVGTGTISNDD